ncbi:270_t:CDS:1, partial [Acaulospora morrowiae]
MAEEYINIDDNVMTGGGLTDEEIVEMVCPSNEEPEEVNNEITVRPIVLVKEVLGGVSNAIEFLINPPEDFTSDVKMILELHK